MKSNLDPDQKKIIDIILAAIRQESARHDRLGALQILLLGAQGDFDFVDEILSKELLALGNRIRLVHAFKSDQERQRWSSRFGGSQADMPAVLLGLDHNFLTQDLHLGEFHLALVFDNSQTSSPREPVRNLKPLLKRKGLLLVETTTERTAEWKKGLVEAGFERVIARSEHAGTKEGLVRDVLMARSDGRVQVSAPNENGGSSELKPSDGRQERAVASVTNAGIPPVFDRAIVRDRLIFLLSRLLRLSPGDLDTSSPFTEFGVDSIAGVRFVNAVNEQLHLDLKPTILFDYASIEKLATFISEQCRVDSAEVQAGGDSLAVADLHPETGPVSTTEKSRREVASATVSPFNSEIRDTDVAVIGMSGRFPGANDIHVFWRNLERGKNSIREVSPDRWDYRQFYDPDSTHPNKTNSKWGGVLDDVDKFDPLFFSISGREAQATDPQQRLFLEECYHALEDAGYVGVSGTVAKKCGVFAGVEPGDYLHLVLDQRGRAENAPVFQGNAESILAARISYLLDLKGPSIAINTACSSSLVAIHLSCQALTSGECDLVLAGGVRVLSSEKAYLALGNMGMLSADGQCKTFDDDANGFVPGEAVGVLVLKRLSAALQAGDHIYGVIKGSATNQDGRTNGITAPSSISQTQVQLEVYEKFNIHPDTLQYIEAHGTGTKLGDPIEVEALTQSFRRFTAKPGFCAIGSVKTNIGHTMAAAGVCSVIKVLLSLQNSKIAPSLNLQRTNRYIDFSASPFFVNTALRDWPTVAGQPRRAAISSFGFSGTNCHLVIEEAPAVSRHPHIGRKSSYLVTISGKTAEALAQSQRRLTDWLAEKAQRSDLEDISFTLNAGRAHFEHRCAIVADSTGDLLDTLRVLSNSGQTHKGWRSAERSGDSSEAVIFQQLVASLLKELDAAMLGPAAYREKLSALAALYAKGYDLDFTALHRGEAHRRISLPGYPFARERYWISDNESTTAIQPARQVTEAIHLHPLVQRNVSTLAQIKFASLFQGREFFLDQHQIQGSKILPGVAYVEMAAAAVREATENSQFALADLVWLRPLSVSETTEVTINLSPDGNDIRFQISSAHGQTIHAEGKAVRDETLSFRREDLRAIRERCTRTESPASLYARCAQAGLVLGPVFQTIREVWFTQGEALALLELPESDDSLLTGFTLHPGLMDGALQITAILARDETDSLPVPFTLAVARFNRLERRCYAYVQRVSEQNDLLRFNVSFLSESGDALVELQRLTMRALRSETRLAEQQAIYVRPVWTQKSLAPSHPAHFSGRLLLFDTKVELANEIGRHTPNLQVVRVTPGANFSAQSGVIELRPDCAEDYDQLLQLGIPDFIIQRWPALDGESTAPTATSILPLFHLTRCLIRGGVNTPVKLLLVHPSSAHPVYPAVAGYARTLRQERPNLHLNVLETDRIEIGELLTELLDPDNEQQVRNLGGRRQVKRLEIFAPERSASVAFREGGVYLITGGLGGLGRKFAYHLAKQVRARLVLLGRSDTASAPVVTELENLGSQAAYFRVDITRRDELNVALNEIRSSWGAIHGVIHAAGVIQDDFLLKKTDDQFAAVLAPKVGGTLLLDEATRRDELDFFVLFSSIAGTLGNVGQSDYSYASCFLDEFARWREDQRHAGLRSGRTVSIDWSLWRNGGMRQSAEMERIKLTAAGLAALEDDAGLAIFSTALQCREPHFLGLAGDVDKIRSLIAKPEKPALLVESSTWRQETTQRAIDLADSASNVRNQLPTSSVTGSKDGGPELRAPALRFLTERFSQQVKIPAVRIRPDDPLEKYGIDSIMVMEFTRLLEQDFGELPKTLLFEYQTLAELTEYFIQHHGDRLRGLVENGPIAGQSAPDAVVTSDEIPLRNEQSLVDVSVSPQANEKDIAIIGLFGRYPMADDLEEFWDNLRVGKDCIIEIPKSRWDYRLFYNPDPSKREPGKPGMTKNKWGGFLNEIERFDANFFNITPREAFALDPQERLFLETVWRTVEDAGYRKSALANRKIGVFVGVMYGEYQLYGAGEIAEGWVYPLSSSYASIANRVSYFFNWHGPSMAIDSMCSSSLTSIHLACESLRRGESELAIAGGVNTTVHPHKDILLSPGGFAASDGRCRSFGEGGDGYVPGEGVGAVLLKPLVKAVADGDHVYAIVKASTVNHDGKTNGYTVPNPKAQAELVLRALSESGIAPDTINYIEAHGTGTSLGDPIEITGLTKAFQESAAGLPLERHSCAIGSVKSNIGHLESAAGIAGVTKVLLQMQYAQLAPSLHSERLNPNINFSESIFYVPQTLRTWEPVDVFGRQVRRAGVSSFGAGGANAHLILEEFPGSNPKTVTPSRAFLIILSAKTEDRLRARAEQLLKYLERPAAVRAELADIAYTLQVGREPLEERLGFFASNAEEVCQNLRRFLSGEAAVELQRGSVRHGSPDIEGLLAGHDERTFVDNLIREQKWEKVAQFWISGGQVEWEQLHRGRQQFRVPLPTYPFAGERYWAPERLIRPKKKDVEDRLHPLIHRNVSDFDGQAFLTRWALEDLVGLKDNQAKRLAGLSVLEMGAVAASLSSRFSFGRITNVTWSAPCLYSEALSLFTKVSSDGTGARFEISCKEIDGPILAQGEVCAGAPQGKEDMIVLRQRCPGLIPPEIWQRGLIGAGLFASSSSLPFSEFWRGDREVLIRFQRVSLDQTRLGGCDWPPVFLEAMLVFAQFLSSAESIVPFAPVSLDSALLGKLPEEGWLHLSVREKRAAEQTIDVRIFQPDGTLAGDLAGLVIRACLEAESPEPLFLRPVWENRDAPAISVEKLSGRLLLLDESAEFEKSIRDQYPTLSVMRAARGARFSSESGFFEINSRAWGDYQRLLEIVNPDFIIHRWVRNSLPLPDALEAGIFSLFRVVRAVMQRNPQSEIRMLFCYPSGTDPAFAAVGAFAKTLMQENPQLQLRILQTDETDASLLAEFFSTPDEREIRRSKDQRQIRTFEIFEPATNSVTPIRKNGVYLITGGLGGLGLILAEHLIKQYQARIVLNGRSTLNDDGRARIAELENVGGQVRYIRADTAREEDVRELVRQAKERFGVLHGVIHAAGVLRDSFLIKKELSDFADVLSPKVRGVVALDEATKNEGLDFFATFSSTAGIFGNVGQSDYAYANAFLDAFVALRESRRLAGERQGKSVSINWPLWKEGGMASAGQNVETHLARIGLYPLTRDTGIAFFEAALRTSESQIAPLWGIRHKLVQTFLRGSNQVTAVEPIGPIDAAALAEKLETYLREILAYVTQLPIAEVNSDQRFEELGVDSIVVGDFNLRLEESLGPMPKTLLFEHPNIRHLSKYLVTAFTPQVARYFGGSVSGDSAREQLPAGSGWKKLERLPRSQRVTPAISGLEEIAIVGLAGRYPGANDVQKFWEILKCGKDCVAEIPKDRWDIDRYYDPDPSKAAEGKIYSRWGAFLDDVDKFDPLFFSIAPIEAELMDPQERLFLETAWHVLEDAGYTRQDLARWVRKQYAANVGVFVGVTTNTYSFVARDNIGDRAMSTLPWSIANRVSYLFNFNGPSLPVDTACSSSLTAIHLACEAIRRGECQQALAGGVNLYLHPSKYVSLCMARMLSTEGKCRAFGAGGDGFVPGEGVGAVFLKPLSLALEQGDHVYAVIKGTSVNHGGRTNGYTVPNPAAQAELVVQALRQSGIEPQTLSYIEAHGTGTALGDPIEIDGLAKAFSASSAEVREASCAIGSVKTNIGHLEGAAGIAGLTKVLLQMRYGQLVPSLHAEQFNSNIAFGGTPFRVQRTLEDWRPLGIGDKIWPRRAGISSFGAGGANAHVVVEEFVGPEQRQRESASRQTPVLIILSAKNFDRLQKISHNLGEFLSTAPEAEISLRSIAYTLQVGREGLEERVAFVTRSHAELISQLQEIGQGNVEKVIHGRVKREGPRVISEADRLVSDPAAIEAASRNDLERLGQLWVDGALINWEELSGGAERPHRLSLPGYPFKKDRYWVPTVTKPVTTEGFITKPLHPLLHQNFVSNLNAQCYQSEFSGREVVFRDHRVAGEGVLAGAASLELVLAGAKQSFDREHVRLRQVVWVRPVIAQESGSKLKLRLLRVSDGGVNFELQDFDSRIHVQGKAEVTGGFTTEQLDVDAIRQRCPGTIPPEQLYAGFAGRGLSYGPGFRVIQDIRYGDGEVLSVVQLSADWSEQKYFLHPALLDGALQSLAMIGAGGDGVAVPFIVDLVECSEALPGRCYAYCQIENKDRDSQRYTVKLLRDDGLVLARLTGLGVRRVERSSRELTYLRPVWNHEEIRNDASISHRVLLLDESSELAMLFKQRGLEVTRVLSGKIFSIQGDVITIRPENDEDYKRLVQDVEFGNVIHRWSRRGAPLKEALNCGLYSVDRLTRALLESGKPATWVYAYPTGDVAYEAIAGYAKSLSQEERKLRIKIVGLEENPAVLAAELSDSQIEVRYRAGQREVRTLEALPTSVSGAERLWVRGGVYLISGGAGGLGRIVAEHLVEKWGARLVLVGRSELGDARNQELRKLGGQVIYLKADVSKLDEAAFAVSEAIRCFGVLNGVIHAAGVLRDGLIRNKRIENCEAVLASKVFGVEALDQATREHSLDCFVLFSSTAGLLGNIGQADYAYANAYLDSFANKRERLRRAGRRSGRSLSINWPLWRVGGMKVNEETLRYQMETLGLQPLNRDEGLRALTHVASLDEIQCAVLCGAPDNWFRQRGPLPSNQRPELTFGEPAASALRELHIPLLADIKQSVAKVLRLDPEILEADIDMSEYGFDSITFTSLANDLNTTLGLEVTPAVLFEYRTLDSFADFLCREYGAKLNEHYLRTPQDATTPANVVPSDMAPIDADATARHFPESDQRPIPPKFSALASGSNAIAIIGMSGVFPGSPDLDAFWHNLDEGKDLITRAPAERWNFGSGSGEGSSPRTALEAPWGGFISDVDKFDSLFFDISPREAELMDPQQRLFLQTVWHTIEDAGYKPSDLAGTKTGLFVGVASNDYGNLLAMHGVPVEAYSATGNSHSVLANRVSYFLDLRGPSEAIDTACSSSLVAIRRAVESLASQSSEMAIVGGVNLLLSPDAFQSFGKAGMLCADGRCKTFDEKADGYVRGEGVGAVFLKPLSLAERDGDHIYAVIIGSAENHGGHVNSLTVPNPNAQADLLCDAYARAGIDPSTIGYIEAHGTGTALGDPIEINGLKKAFAQSQGEVPTAKCAVGSVKANIGHLETAAGIAGLAKVLLAIRHQRIPGNIHLQQLNPYIQVEGTPFYFPRQSEVWNAIRDRAGHEMPRRAGISSFGFGGANAHVLLEEYHAPARALEKGIDEDQIFVFSARNSARLHDLVTEFIGYLERLEKGQNLPPPGYLNQIAYTLQIGRELMAERLAIITANLSGLVSSLKRFLDGDRRNLFHGNVAENQANRQLLRQLHDGDFFVESLLEQWQLSKLAALWVNGFEPDWRKLRAGAVTRRISLPGYVFERQRHWIPAVRTLPEPVKASGSRLHPLLHRNESTLQKHVYTSQFSGQETFLREHQVHEQRVLPGAASLELALAGAVLGLGNERVRLQGVTWTRPIVADENGVATQLELRSEGDGRARFELKNSRNEIHALGEAEANAALADEVLDLDAIRARCHREIAPADLYSEFRAQGLHYGRGFQVIQRIVYNSGEAISLLELPESWTEIGYRLHPALLDGGFQTLAILDSVSDGVEVPFAVDVVEYREPLPRQCYAYGRIEKDENVRRYELKLVDERGAVLVRIGGFTVRHFERRAEQLFSYRPVWVSKSLAHRTSSIEGTVLLFDDSSERAEHLNARGVSVVRVVTGESYERQANMVTVRRKEPQDYTRLVEEVDFTGIIHCWSSDRVSLNEALERGPFSIHYLSQALLKCGKTGTIVYVYPKEEMAYAAVAAYAKSLRLEQPKLLLKTIGGDGASIDFSAELNDDHPEVRYVAEQREVRTLEDFPFGATGESVFKPGGVYLITGGAGGLGKIIAEHLVQKYGAQLALVGRSDLTESKRNELQRLGGSVFYIRADIGTVDGASEAIRLTKERFGAINGLIHAAGVLCDGLIWNKSVEDFETVLRSKVRGVELLDDLTSQEPLGCFILFSSTAGLFGSAGQSDYSFANAYLDSFAHRRARLCQAGLRSGRTISLNWPVWREGGMRGNGYQRATALGLVPLDKSVGLQLLERALASSAVQVWCGVGDRQKISQNLLEEPPKEPRGRTISSPNGERATAATNAAPKDMTDYLIRQFAALAKLDPDQIKTTEPLESYGLDSIMAVEFSQRLEQDFGALSKTLLFEYPTLVALAAYLLEHGAGRSAEVAFESRMEGADGLKAAVDGFPLKPKPINPIKLAPKSESAALRQLPLAPIDYAFVGPGGFPIQVLYYFERHLDFNDLRLSLRQVTDAFFPINSRLILRGENEYVIQECEDEPDFEEVLCDANVVAPEQDRQETYAPFEVFFDPLNPNEKMAKFRLFRMATGTLLSVNVSHAIADGYSFYYFLSAWAAASRGEHFQIPEHSRGSLTRLVEQYRLRSDGDSNGFAGLDWDVSLNAAGSVTNRIDTMRLDGGKLLAQARETADELIRHKLTENGVLTAVVWQTYAQSLDSDAKELLLACPIDFRRVSRDLSRSFFGNASAPALLRLDRKMILNEPVPSLAAMISDAVRSCDENTLIRYCAAIDGLRRAHGLAATNSVRLVDPRAGLIVTNVARFPLPPVDFGTGPFRREFTPVNYAGTAVIVGDNGPTLKVRLAYPEPLSR